jgi:Lar family restriction alleviation protein
MEKRKLGEQWVEVIDGVKHMVKAVKGVCENCGVSHLCNLSSDCPMAWGFIAKDLGILNEDGLLPCPFCGEYPVVQPENSRAGFGCHCDKCKCAVSGLHESMEELIEEWNRRV